ncbi:MAG: DEAD/DEAH box helicase family protein [Candidatus Binataceae bacterium]
MPDYEVPEPILNSPYEEPAAHWLIEEGKIPEKRPGRREAGYWYRDPKAPAADTEHEARGVWQPLERVNLIREDIKKWRAAGYPGASRTTIDLLNYWQREGRQHRLFFAQLEAAETIIFLTEARADFKQGISIPLDEPSDEQKRNGLKAFVRYALKMATGTGKTTVMAMLAAWSILNKVNDKSDSRFSDTVLVVCPNVTIRNRLAELDPERGDASLYRTRDLVPSELMPDLSRGKVIVTNWHVFEPQAPNVGGTSARVIKTGERVEGIETITIGPKKTVARGRRYLTPEEYERQKASGQLEVVSGGEERDEQGNLKRARVRSYRYVKSETALVNDVLKAVGGKQNILVFNDEAHHAYRIRQPEGDENEEENGNGADEEFYKEATVWIDGLDKINKLRGINFCVDLSATPYYLGRVGQATNRIFPWTVSEFGLTDSIESGLTKIPQLVVTDTTGERPPPYFNIWRWVLNKLTTGERGARRESPKPEAVLKYADTPIKILGGRWERMLADWKRDRPEDLRPPVFIVVCKNTAIAKVIYQWLGEGQPPNASIAPANIAGFRNTDDVEYTIRVDSKVIAESDDLENAKNDETKWMRFTLDTVGKRDWPIDTQGRPVYPQDFEELANKLKRPLHPPGRDVRCIVSVGMLTEGWDCSTVTHIVGLRPFMSQLLCEQVVGRGLRRASYEPIEKDGKQLLTEEIAEVFGVPFEIIPFKESKTAAPRPREKRHHVHAIPEKAHYAIGFPRVEGYRQAVRNRIAIDWNTVPPIRVNPLDIPPEVGMKAGVPNNKGRFTLSTVGKTVLAGLMEWRAAQRIQKIVFEMATALTRDYVNRPDCIVPAHALFPQLRAIVDRYIREKVEPIPPGEKMDVGISPYYGWVIEALLAAIHPDQSSGEEPELPIYDKRGDGSTANVDFWTSRDAREIEHSHLNYVVADTAKWEQSAAYFIDTHKLVDAFAKNAGLGFAIPYFHNGQDHDYVSDFIVRLKTEPPMHLILEIKGYDELKEVKAAAAHRWVKAVNADGTHGVWDYALVTKPTDVPAEIEKAAKVG